jgi:ribosome biogenesis GTPase A
LICFRLTAGKSTLLNRILDWQKGDNAEYIKQRAGNQNARKGAVTTSPLPGTTLKFIEVDLGDGQKLIDTPGLLVDGTLTQLLTPAELKIVVPQKYVICSMKQCKDFLIAHLIPSATEKLSLSPSASLQESVY